MAAEPGASAGPRWALAVDRASRAIGRAASWCTLALVLVVFLAVLLRYAFGRGSIALQEAGLWLHSVVFLLGAVWALEADQHVRVDLLHQRWSPRGRALADLVGTLLFLLPFCVFLVWVSLDYVAAAWAVREGSREPGGLPGVFLLKTLIPICGALLALQGLALAARRIAALRNPPR